MIVSANAYSVSKPVTERPAAMGTSSATAQTGTASEDAGPDPLTMLDDFMESAALSRKAFAEDRLDHLKEQMNTLALFNLAPGFLVGHSARMAKELEAAATDFASSFKTLAGLGRLPGGEQAGSQVNGLAATDDKTPAMSPALPLAYLDILGDDAPGRYRLSEQDLETAASFMSTAHHLRGVVEMMADDARDKPVTRWNAETARDATSRVVDIMVRLEGPSAFNKVYW
ncbi:MAG: hypothetical protein KUA43_03640 [Hoeflea sp.]|uniref:hypothetical protein n=1 Tax=Hoeflea sp. TaxID=1940281 RepID=UPI001D9E151A|nr:hypothetical protein [Hoeflea sp.]MBU4530021.1 hypothetical protein [Alphaproteobacteria bacterium]MBU4543248.1 hypothetical protein [Alphaproteobacteria bacterium]MBU4550212.1 hypothetical protein [Alphaproteobacteria bacterium]MBV1722516.1 hypothetical protein [Hoeflea sp.]MBV1761666.1 hypothetical protein [Hoeflea sp.]